MLKFITLSLYFHVGSHYAESGRPAKSQGSSLGSGRPSKRRRQSSDTSVSRTSSTEKSQTTNDPNAQANEMDINSNNATGQTRGP